MDIRFLFGNTRGYNAFMSKVYDILISMISLRILIKNWGWFLAKRANKVSK